MHYDYIRNTIKMQLLTTQLHMNYFIMSVISDVPLYMKEYLQFVYSSKSYIFNAL